MYKFKPLHIHPNWGLIRQQGENEGETRVLSGKWKDSKKQKEQKERSWAHQRREGTVRKG